MIRVARPRWIAVLVAVLAVAAAADGLIIIPHPPPMPPHPPRPPHPWPLPHHEFAPLEVRYHHVTARIDDQVAVTNVDQVFYNPNSQRLEGLYLFPVPKGARIDRFSMDINGKEAEAELLDADKARQIYEDIVRRMRDPALLEYAGQSLFKVRVYPIEPHSEKRIRLSYTELLRNDAGMVSYVYPLNTEKFSARPLRNVLVKVDLSCAKGVKSVFCPSHTVEITRHGSSKATIGYEADNVRPDTDFQLFFAPEARSDVGIDVLTYRESEDRDGGFFLLLASPSVQHERQRVVEKDVVFVLDTSGSMAERGKIDAAKRALALCLRNLNDGDRFEVVRFSTEAEALFEGLVPANSVNRAKAETFVEGLKPIGGTAIQEALATALKHSGEARDGRPYVVVFLTDGKPTIGPTSTDEIVSDVTKRIGDQTIRVFCFGIGTDVNTHLLDLITEKTRAASQYVLPDEDIEIKVSSFYAKINEPVLTDLELVITAGIRPSKLVPGMLPDLFRGDQLVVLGRYSGTGDAAVTIKGSVNGTPRSFTHEVGFPRAAIEHAFIPRLWATRRVGFLLDQIRLNGESAELRDEVVELARKYGIVTPYTAYLIVEDEDRRGLAQAERSLPQFDAELHEATGRMYRQLPTTVAGDAAVGGAQGLDALKRAKGMSAPGIANTPMLRGGRATVASPVADRMEQAVTQKQNRYVGGRTFYQNGGQWIDANVQTETDARRVQVKIGSVEYFALLAKHPNAAQWLSVGRNVQVLLDDTVYEVID
ncbi:MAG: VIT and VWA domain-containing protein [Candidatus Eisenbacteria bacterium]|nr:VIT and VWA domain-containing protein [Candidatus Eisenbacteria bacterium]